MPLPRGNDKVAGVTFKATITAGVTLRLAVPVKDPEVALIVVIPTAVATAVPVEFTEATAMDELHVAVCVRSCVVPSEKAPLAVNCSVSPRGKETWLGLTVTLINLGDPTVIVVLPVIPW